jgi:hypothetical protein
MTPQEKIDGFWAGTNSISIAELVAWVNPKPVARPLASVHGDNSWPWRKSELPGKA